MKNSVFPFFCYAESNESEKDAWDKFNEELEYHLSFINGYKYWRSIPRIVVDKRYQDDEITYSVTSRIYASLDSLDGHSPVELGKPFPIKLGNKLEDATTLVGFKLENRAEKTFKITPREEGEDLEPVYVRLSQMDIPKEETKNED